ncbi:MAG: autotransporter outer membrane beta-barrel domain-containing protein [Hyphomicrobium sp.]
MTHGSAAAQDQPAQAGIKITPYVDGGYTRVQDKRTESPSLSDNWQLTAGLDLAVTTWLEIGGGVTIGDGDTDFGRGPVTIVTNGADFFTSQVVGGEAKTQSWTVFGRATVTLPGNFGLGAIGGYSETEADEVRDLELTGISTARQSWSRDSENWFIGGNISYTQRWDRWFAVPGARVLYTDTHNAPYRVVSRIDDPLNGTFFQTADVVATDDDLLRGQFGTDIGYFFQCGSAYLVPILRAYWVHDFNLSDGFRDRDAADLSASLNYIDGALTLGGEFQTTVGRDETETYGGRGYLLYKF